VSDPRDSKAFAAESRQHGFHEVGGIIGDEEKTASGVRVGPDADVGLPSDSDVGERAERIRNLGPWLALLHGPSDAGDTHGQVRLPRSTMDSRSPGWVDGGPVSIALC
jgi:hypothetical protein